MTKKIFVGNLSFQTSDNDLNDLFTQFGEVESVSIITDRDTGRSKGFGFVAMGDDSAEKAISQLNGKEVNGRALTVNEARPMVKKDFGGGGRQNSGRGGGRGGYGRY
jgi:cold-inducible RNA-binding protein